MNQKKMLREKIDFEIDEKLLAKLNLLLAARSTIAENLWKSKDPSIKLSFDLAMAFNEAEIKELLKLNHLNY